MPDFDSIERALKAVDRELWIVTAAAGERRGGLVATWVSSASLDRQQPVLIAGIAPNHYTRELIDASGAAALHLIGRDQLDLAFNFALGSGRERDKLAGVSLRPSSTGAPLLADCVAWCEGQVFHRYDAGDRIFYWLDIVGGGRERDDPPARESDLFAAASPAQRAQLVADRDADVARQRPLREAWRTKIARP
jgi:flavin reductase (DIM6/NTAB) family NADH-FMN oxidoreductase RutF